MLKKLDVVFVFFSEQIIDLMFIFSIKFRLNKACQTFKKLCVYFHWSDFLLDLVVQPSYFLQII